LIFCTAFDSLLLFPKAEKKFISTNIIIKLQLLLAGHPNIQIGGGGGGGSSSICENGTEFLVSMRRSIS
jgi:hypothetical protein